MTTQELLDLKQEIEEAKDEVKKLEARRDVLMEQMKEKFGVSTLAAARKKINKMQEDVTALAEKIDDAATELEEKLNEHRGTTE